MIFQIFGTLYEDSRANNIRYDPVLSATLGKQVLVLVNLAPRVLKGIESQGMILMAESPTGTLSIVAPTDYDSAAGEIPTGSVVG